MLHVMVKSMMYLIVFLWRDGEHQVTHKAGGDLSDEISKTPPWNRTPRKISNRGNP